MLSTGEMIDSLRVGETAVSDRGGYKVFYDGGALFYDDGIGKPSRFFIDLEDKNRKWRIVPQYVTFEEAMEALKEGKKVNYYDQEGNYLGYIIPTTSLRTITGSFERLFDYKWSVEDDS